MGQEYPNWNTTHQREQPGQNPWLQGQFPPPYANTNIRDNQRRGLTRRAGCISCLGLIGLALLIVAGGFLATFAGFRFVITQGPVVVLPSTSAVYIQVQKMDRLETVSYNLESVYTYDENANSPWYNIWKYISNQKKLFVIPGTVTAGVDLSQLTQQDVQIHGKAITLTLPPSRILDTSLDEQNIKVYDISTGLAIIFQNMDPNTQDQILTAAKASFQNDACQKGDILQKAADNARQQFIPFLTELGFTNVTINAPSGTC